MAFVVFFLEIQRTRIYTIALSRRLRPVFKDVAKMCIAILADNLSAEHPVTRIIRRADAISRFWLVKARPSRTLIELGARVK